MTVRAFVLALVSLIAGCTGQAPPIVPEEVGLSFDPGPPRFPETPGMHHALARMLYRLNATLDWTNGTEFHESHLELVAWAGAVASRNPLEVRRVGSDVIDLWVEVHGPVDGAAEIRAFEAWVLDEARVISDESRTEARALAEANLALVAIGVDQTIERHPRHAGLQSEAVGIGTLHYVALGVEAARRTNATAAAEVTPGCATALLAAAEAALEDHLEGNATGNARSVLTAEADWLPAAKWALARNFTGGAAIQAYGVLNAVMPIPPDWRAISNDTFQENWDAAAAETRSDVVASSYMRLAEHWEGAHRVISEGYPAVPETSPLAVAAPASLLRQAASWDMARRGDPNCAEPFTADPEPVTP